jgi:hypothetical protein
VPVLVVEVSWTMLGLRVTEALVVLPAASYALSANRSEGAGLAPVAQEVTVGPKVVVEGEVATTLASAALSAAFQVTVTGTAVELTVPVRTVTAGAAGKVGAVVSPTRDIAPDVVVDPRTWVARTWTLWLPEATGNVADWAEPEVCATVLPSTRTSNPEISTDGVEVVQLTVAELLV